MTLIFFLLHFCPQVLVDFCYTSYTWRKFFIILMETPHEIMNHEIRRREIKGDNS